MPYISDEKIMTALLNHPTIEAAADACGVGRATIHRRLSDPAFKAEYTARRRQIVEAACGSLQGRMGEAVEALAEIMNDGKASKLARVQAARTVLEYGIRTVETLDLLPRIEALEEAMEGKP